MILLRALGRLPWRMLYWLADVLFVIIYYCVRYRRRLVRANLKGAFPNLPADERRRIERQFYRNFADYIVETVKLLHISDSEMRQRMAFENVGLIDAHTAAGRDVAIYFSHCFNWEWAPSVTLHANPDTSIAYCQVYRPLKSKSFDRLMLEVRGRFGSVSLPKATTLRRLLELRRRGLRTVTGFMSDQKPSHGDQPVEVRFLNRPTHFIHGTEVLASKMKMAAVYWHMTKTGRGHYRIRVEPLSDDASALPTGELTRRYAAALEKNIIENPELWLWSHNRWKIPKQQL